MNPIPFTKMSGSGNDFILIDNREAVVPAENRPQFVSQVCRRKMSAGADGLILVERSDRVDFSWDFYNSDGSVAEMCGNGARCVARFAHLQGIATERMAFETIAGIIHAQVMDDAVRIKMTAPQDMLIGAELELVGQTVHFSSVNTGVPHAVIAIDHIDSAEVVEKGQLIRHHPQFAPAGTNVNFIAPLNGSLWTVRTYERGVEDETLACGTGIVASALVLAETKGLPSPITLETRSGSRLKVYYAKTNHGYADIFLEGDARMIYAGQLMPDAWLYE